MHDLLLNFVETAAFNRQVTRLLTDDEYARMQWRLMQVPEIGDVIPGAGGIRKFRFGIKGKGARGGARVIYYFAAQHGKIYMLDLYAKNEQADIPLPRLRELATLVKDWLTNER